MAIKESIWGEHECWGYQIEDGDKWAIVSFSTVHPECENCIPDGVEDCAYCSCDFSEEATSYSVRRSNYLRKSSGAVDILLDELQEFKNFPEAMNAFVGIVKASKKEVMSNDR